MIPNDVFKWRQYGHQQVYDWPYSFYHSFSHGLYLKFFWQSSNHGITRTISLKILHIALCGHHYFYYVPSLYLRYWPNHCHERIHICIVTIIYYHDADYITWHVGHLLYILVFSTVWLHLRLAWYLLMHCRLWTPVHPQVKIPAILSIWK